MKGNLLEYVINKEDLYGRCVSQAIGKRVYVKGVARSVASLKGHLGKGPLMGHYIQIHAQGSTHTLSMTEKAKVLFPCKLIALLEWKILF